MKENMVMLVSKSDRNLVVNIPELRFSRTWTRRGMKIPVERDTLEQAYYDASFAYLIDKGLLFVEDMEVKKDLGIEPIEATEPVNILDLTDTLMARMIKAMPMDELKKTVAKLSGPQREDLAEYAIEHNDSLNMSKIDFLSQISGRDILTAIKNKKAAEEE